MTVKLRRWDHLLKSAVTYRLFTQVLSLDVKDLKEAVASLLRCKWPRLSEDATSIVVQHIMAMLMD